MGNCKRNTQLLDKGYGAELAIGREVQPMPVRWVHLAAVGDVEAMTVASRLSPEQPGYLDEMQSDYPDKWRCV